MRANTGNSNAQFNQSGVPIVDAGNMSMPVSGNINVLPPESMTQDNYKGTARAMLGDLTYSPSQFAAAIQNLGSAEKSKLAQNLITSGNAEKMRQGAILQKMNPGLYFDKGTAQKKLSNDYTIGMDRNLKALQSKNYKTDKDSAVDEKVGMNKNKLEAEVKEKVGLDKNEKGAEVAKYKFDNKVINIAVGKDKQVIVDKNTGKKLGIKPTKIDGKDVYVFDGKQSIDKIQVKVGKSDVYMNKEMAEKLGITPNANGQYIIKGSGYNDGTSGSGGSGSKSGMKTTDVKNTLANLKTTYEQFTNYTDNLPQGVIGNIEKQIMKMMKADMDDGMSRDQAFINNARGIISQGVVSIPDGMMSSFFAPKFFVDYHKRSTATNEQLIKVFKGLGYNDGQAKTIADFIRPSN